MTTTRRTAALVSVAASLALPAAATAKDAPASLYHPPRDHHAQVAPEPANNHVDWLAVGVTGAAIAACGGCVYSLRRTTVRRHAVRIG